MFYKQKQLKNIINKYEQFKEKYPEAANDLEAIINISSLLTIGGVSKTAGKNVINKTLNITNTTLNTAKKAKPVIKSGIKNTKNILEDISETAISQAGAMEKDTIKNIIKYPKYFSNKSMQKITREELGKKIKLSINKRLENLSTIGKEYEPIRKLSTKINTGNIFKDSLSKYGLKIKNGVIKMTSESKPFLSSELNQIENFLSIYGKKNLTVNSFLNAREALSNIAKFETGKSSNLINWAKDVRKSLNEIAHNKIPELKKIDKVYSAEKSLLKEIKKDYFKKGTSEFKDNALSKIANLTNEGKQQILNRLKLIDPNIDFKVKILKSIEDIKKSKGIKVGTYTRSGIALGGVISGNIPLAIGAALSQPQLLVPILRNFGKLKNIGNKKITNIINKLKNNKLLTKDEKEIVNNAIKKSIKN